MNDNMMHGEFHKECFRKGVNKSGKMMVKKAKQRMVTHITCTDEQQAARTFEKDVRIYEISIFADNDSIFPISQSTNFFVGGAVARSQVQSMHGIVPLLYQMQSKTSG
jgi:hypothetical protein